MSYCIDKSGQLGVIHCYTRHVYWYSYVRFGALVGGPYVVDDYGNLVQLDDDAWAAREYIEY